ncbi:MAG: hypothetical protein OXE47_07880, partial [Gammaproteobacteria bacterium]|nr:hypothetical protein [Gammaproteobacteria bacterium]
MTTLVGNFTIVVGTVDDDIPEPDETITFAIADSGISILLPTTPPTWAVGSPASVTITIVDNDGYVDPDAPVADNPTARAERLEAPAAAVARGVGTLAVEAITRRVNGSSSLGFWASSGYV